VEVDVIPPAAVGRSLPRLDHQRGGASRPYVSHGRVSRRASIDSQLDEVPVGGSATAADSARLTAAPTVITHATPQGTNGAAEVVRHKAVDERVDATLGVWKQVYHQLSTCTHTHLNTVSILVFINYNFKRSISVTLRTTSSTYITISTDFLQQSLQSVSWSPYYLSYGAKRMSIS